MYYNQFEINRRIGPDKHGFNGYKTDLYPDKP